ncbi:protocatechuate 4,5-dioxygenase [Klebsiella variicola]|uniref:Protocatechuate 4,5-dioxygenase n=1 Tax=Klebsiella variicola TaxID=244366 RepID=A0A7H4MA20_KLEVA|nr:protocatechuate 4,5-dioxygenase [Klebsiella variicola]
MANILGGIAVSHTPTIGFAVDHHKQQDPAWSPIFQSFEPLQRWLEEKKPDALVYIFNDHVTAFFFDHYSTFTLGIDSQYDVAMKAADHAVCRRSRAMRRSQGTLAPA